MMRMRLPWDRTRPALWTLAILAGATPLWVSRRLPMVDLPQHLYVLEVLRRLHDPRTLFPQIFVFHPVWSPYVGYYAIVGALAWVLPVDVANRAFLTLMLAALPLSLAFLLRSLGRPAWAALLAIPFAYGDSFGWGFVHTSSAIPLALFSLGAAIRSVTDPPRRWRWALLLGFATFAGFTLHPVPTGFLVFALPVALLSTVAPEERSLRSFGGFFRARLPALIGLAPVTLTALVWAVSFTSAPVDFKPGVPHAAWGPMLSAENVERVRPFETLGAFLWLLGNLMLDGSDALAILAVITIVAAACVARLFESAPRRHPVPFGRERLLPWALTAIGLALSLFLPLNIRGWIYYLSPRYVPLTAALALGLLPRPGPRSDRWLTTVAILPALVSGIFLAIGFRAFDREARALDDLSRATRDRPRILGLMFDRSSRIVYHPVYVHAAAVLARDHGGVPNYTLAGGRQIPLRYRGQPPTPLESEWHPEGFTFARLAGSYDHFLLRGASPDSVFVSHLRHELSIAAHVGNWWLVERTDTTHRTSFLARTKQAPVESAGAHR